MATREPRNTVKTESAVPVPVDATRTIPEAWGEDVEIYAGHDLTDKKDLVGVPFLITGVEIERTDGKDYDVAYVYCIDEHGTEFEFSDTSSNGVRAQLQAFLVEKGKSPTPGAGLQTIRLASMKGLRVFEFDGQDEVTGKKQKRYTYYLTAGVRKANVTS